MARPGRRLPIKCDGVLGFWGDWSSDVCSSDLPKTPKPQNYQLLVTGGVRYQKLVVFGPREPSGGLPGPGQGVTEVERLLDDDLKKNFEYKRDKNPGRRHTPS